MWEEFILPSVSTGALIRARVELPEPLRRLRPVSPALQVLPMGFSWSLFFCQRLVERCTELAGFSRAQMLYDKRTSPTLEKQELGAAVYVDGVAVFGTCEELVIEGTKRVKQALEKYGLKCGSHVDPSDDQTFVGLQVDRESGRLSISERKIWKLRLGILHLLRRGRASGEQLRHILGHFTWASMIAAREPRSRRQLLHFHPG